LTKNNCSRSPVCNICMIFARYFGRWWYCPKWASPRAHFGSISLDLRLDDPTSTSCTMSLGPSHGLTRADMPSLAHPRHLEFFSHENFYNENRNVQIKVQIAKRVSLPQGPHEEGQASLTPSMHRPLVWKFELLAGQPVSLPNLMESPVDLP
jgi:hypothetical protein